jgi:iron transport multicopper oxidase
MVNNVSYVSPESPTLLRVIAGADEAADFNVTENTFILPRNKVVDITFPPKWVTSRVSSFMADNTYQ